MRFVGVLVCTMSLWPSLAQAVHGYEPFFACERDHQSIAIASDCSYRFTQDRIVRIQRDVVRWKTFFAKLQRDLWSQVVYR